MKILVPVKRVVDHNVKVRVKADQSGVDTANVKMSMNPFDEIALEQAVQLKEKGVASEIIIVSIGATAVQDTLRTGLAMGADRAIAVTFGGYDQAGLEPLIVAKILAKIAQDENPDLILCGKQAIDDDYGATGQMLAGLLGWNQAMFASSVKVDGRVATVTREIDQGLQDIAVDLPAVISADLRLNEPRYPSLPNIMKAKKKPIDVRNIGDYGFDLTPRLHVLNVTEPPAREGGVMLETVEQLVDKIQETGAVR